MYALGDWQTIINVKTAWLFNCELDVYLYLWLLCCKVADGVNTSPLF